MILKGDCREVLKTLESESVNCCITSPPYFGLRNYGHSDQLGLEKTPSEYVENLVKVFREVRRVLKDKGTLWLNLGDTYAMTSLSGKTENLNDNVGSHRKYKSGCQENIKKEIPLNLKAKDLIGIPWRVAFALQADGWYLRQDIIWHKPNAMPESVKDRCTKSHEYIFLLSKQSK
jgi:DNA modification methylase